MASFWPILSVVARRKLWKLPKVASCGQRDFSHIEHSQGFGQEISIFKINIMLSFYTLMVFLNFWCIVIVKNQSQSFYLLLWNYFFSETRFRHPTVALLIIKMRQVTIDAFSLHPIRDGHWRQSTNHRGGNFDEGFVHNTCSFFISFIKFPNC